MKRIIAIFLIAIIVLSTSGCQGNLDFDEEVAKDWIEQEASKGVDDLIDKVKDEVSNKNDGEKIKKENTGNWLKEQAESVGNWVKEGFESVGNGLLNSYYDLFGYNMIITYVANGGINAPSEQRFKENTEPKITKNTPTREGYHFVGWTRQEGSNEPEFFAGKKTVFTFTQDTKLYACWEAYDRNDPLTISSNAGKTINIWGGQENFVVEHNYKITKEYEGKIIRIHCDCGFELIDRDLSLDNFVAIKSKGKNETFDSLKDSKKEEYKKDHILYRTQDFAPVAIALIGSFYESFESDKQDFDPNSSNCNEKNYDEPISVFEEMGEALEFAANFELAYLNSEYARDFVELKSNYYDHYDDYTIAYLLREMRPEDTNALLRESKTTFFTRAAKLGKGINHAAGLARAIYYGLDAWGSNEMASSKTISMIKAIHTLVNYCPYIGDYYDQLFNTLEEGLVLYDKCLKKGYTYETFLAEILPDDGLEAIQGTGLTLQHIDQARNNNFDDDAPSVMELIGPLLLCPEGSESNYYSLLPKNQKALVVGYLTMRMEYDFKNEYGITLEEYMEYVQ